ncbi:hypothetical protein E2320_019796, partial [Naja naja]
MKHAQIDTFEQQDSSPRKNENPVEEWTFYPSSGNHTYHIGKRCLFYGIHLRNKATSSERTLENSSYKKRSDTFIPLQRLPVTPSVSFRVKEKELELEREKKEVQNLETWKPSP